MRFGPIATVMAEGAVLAHMVRHGDAVYHKGRVLSAADVAALAGDGIETLVVAQLDEGDVPENEASALLAEALKGDGTRAATAFTGRSNLYATVGGLFRVKAAAIDAINAVDEAITVATLPDHDAVSPGAMLVTVKIIPYAVRRASLNAALSLAKALDPVVEVAPFRSLRVGLVSTSLPNTKPSILAKNRATLEARLAPSRAAIVSAQEVPHEAAAVAEGIRSCRVAGAQLVLIYSASAIADRHDVVPAGLSLAGGTITRFGMPVDPGNLILLGRLGALPVVGIPGCARSPKLNGFDWVLQRLLAGIEVSREDVSRMGVGGLLKEIPSRPQPRGEAQAAPRIAAVVLAAGRSQRMGAVKQLAAVDGVSLLRRTVGHVLESAVSQVVVVTGHEADAVEASLEGLDVTFVRNADYAEGLSSSLKAGLAALPDEVDGALIVLGDMPAVDAGAIDRLVGAFAPDEGRGIVVPSHEGVQGNPVLWATRYFEGMQGLSGDRGAKALLQAFSADVHEVPLGPGVLTDIDTPAELAAFVERGR